MARLELSSPASCLRERPAPDVSEGGIRTLQKQMLDNLLHVLSQSGLKSLSTLQSGGVGWSACRCAQASSSANNSNVGAGGAVTRASSASPGPWLRVRMVIASRAVASQLLLF